MDIRGLIVGLGNPGSEYERTRHNFGFMAVEALLDAWSGTQPPRLISGRTDNHRLWRVTDQIAGADWLFCLPLTFMNRSGTAVQQVAAYYRVAPAQILVLHDELDLPLGRMKLKKGGGNAGHNGLRSIQQMLGTPDFYRLRLGIGKSPGRDGAGYVLARFTAQEQEALAATLAAARQGTLLFLRQGERVAQQFCNGFSFASPSGENKAEAAKPPLSSDRGSAVENGSGA